MKDSIKIREYDKIIIVDLQEFVNKGSEEIELKSILMEVIAKNKNVAVNLKATAYIDSGIVAALLAAYRGIQQYGKQLYIIAPSQQAKDILSVTGLNHIISFFNDEKDLF